MEKPKKTRLFPEIALIKEIRNRINHGPGVSNHIT